MKTDPSVAQEMHRRAEEHEKQSNPPPTDSYQKYVYNEVVKIRKWVTFFGVFHHHPCHRSVGVVARKRCIEVTLAIS